MSDLDFRRLAEEWVERIYISDPEWKECLLEQYMEILQGATNAQKGQAEYIRPYLIVSNNDYRH